MAYFLTSWFITYAPADIHHPIAIYFADTKQAIYPPIVPASKRIELIASNLVAGARFFKFIIDAFIQNVLEVETSNKGLYSKTAGYYRTIEQQSCLTLHMHMLI